MQTLRGRYLRTLTRSSFGKSGSFLSIVLWSMANIPCMLWDIRLGTVFWVVLREYNGSVDGFDIAVAVNLLQ